MIHYRAELSPLSPIHVGTGQTCGLLDYVVFQDPPTVKDGFLVVLDHQKFFDDLPETAMAEFDRLTRDGDIRGLHGLFRQNLNPDRHTRYDSWLPPYLIGVYREALPNPDNQLLIETMIRRPGRSLWKPLLPGSSVKGAIRTAVLSQIGAELPAHRANQLAHSRPHRFESELLGYRDAKQDPFRCLRVADAVLPSECAVVRRIVNAGRPHPHGPLVLTGIQMIHDTVDGRISPDHEGEVTTVARLDIHDQLPNTQARNRKGETHPAVVSGITAQQIVSACNRFYRDKLLREHEDFYAGTIAGHPSEQLLGLTENLPADTCLLRLGRFSHAESVTVDGFRDPRGRGGKHSTTRNLAVAATDGQRTPTCLYPMGWLTMRLAPLGSRS